MTHMNTIHAKLRYFIYLRKSTMGDERQQRSIPDQLAEIRELVRKEQLEVVDVLAEMQSAKEKGRPVFNEMLARIEAGEADGIICWAPDRLSRNAHDGGRVIDMLDEGTIKDLRFCSFWFENTAQGKFMLMWAFGQGKYYVDKLADDIRRGQRRKVAEGVWSWKAPMGYTNEPKLRTIVPHPVMAPLVKRMFEMYATGEYPILHLCALMNKAGLHGDRSTVLNLSGCQHILKNPFYYGVFSLRGELHLGSHEPLISKELFDRCQDIMSRRSNTNTAPRLKSYVYRGLLRCAHCGCTVTMETQKGHNYLRCTKRVQRDCPQPYLREDVLTRQIASELASFSIPDEWADWMVGELAWEREEDGLTVSAELKADEKEMDKLDKKIDRLTAGFLEAGAFTPTEFKKRKEELVNAKRVLMDKMAARSREDVQRFEPVIRFINRSKQGKYVAERCKPAELRSELEQIGSNLRLDSRKLVFDPRGAWKTVVGQGSFAHNNTAAPVGAAVSRGESHLVPLKWSRGESNPRPGTVRLAPPRASPAIDLDGVAAAGGVFLVQPLYCFSSLRTGAQKRVPARCHSSPPHRASGGDDAASIRQRERSCGSQLCVCTLVDAAGVRRGAPRRAFPVRSKPIGPDCQRTRDHSAPGVTRRGADAGLFHQHRNREDSHARQHVSDPHPAEPGAAQCPLSAVGLT